MRIVTLSCGSIYIKEKDDHWLFGAPEGVMEAIKNNGLEFPNVIFTTVLKCKGLNEFSDHSDYLVFRGKPLRTANIHASIINRKHGTDYEITSPDARILFSERGDVSLKDIKEYDLAVIKNKHRSESMGENVITWPWPDSEFVFGTDDSIEINSTADVGSATTQAVDIAYKVYKKLDDVPANLKKMDGIPLSLNQANFIARVADDAGKQSNVESGFAIANNAFKKKYVKKDGAWVLKEKEDDVKTATKDRDEMEMPYDNPGADFVKFAKDAINYKEKNEKNSSVILCGNCVYFRSVNSCKLVDGEILPSATCDLWKLNSVLAYKANDELMNTISSDRIAENRTLGNILIANLHTAYNDTADQFARDGLVSQDERIDIANAIGPALTTFKEKLDTSVYNRELPANGVVMVPLPTSFKEYSEELPDEVPEDYFYTFKDKDDWMWLSVTSKAIWDRHDQKFSEKAMDWAIKFSNLLGIRGPLRFRHIPGLDGGICLKQSRVEEYLIELGKYDRTPLGISMRKLASDGSGKWKMSAGLAYTSKDLKPDGEYDRAIIFERSMTDGPAVSSTIIENLSGGSDMTVLSDEQLSKVAEELGLEASVVKALIEKADSSSSQNGDTVLKEAYKAILGEALKVTNPGGANASKRQDIDADGSEDEDEEIEMVGGKVRKRKKDDTAFSEDELRDTVAQLSDYEFSALKDIVTEVDEMPTTYKLQSQLDDMGELLAANTTALKSMMQLIAIGNNNVADTATPASDANQVNVQEVMKELMSNLPRSQSSTFVSDIVDSNGSVNDDQVLASLKAIEAKLDASPIAGNKDGIYDLFTSKVK